MSDFFKLFSEKEIQSRKTIIEDRKIIYTWGIDPRTPGFMQEKMSEIKLMVILGLDNFIMKVISIFVEEILINMNVAHEIVTSGGDYKDVAERHQKKDGHELLKRLKELSIIHPEDFSFCVKFFSPFKVEGGENVRNIEVHNKDVLKAQGFRIREDIVAGMDDFGREFVEGLIKSSPGFMQIGNRDVITRDIIEYLAKLHDLINRNVEILDVLNRA